MFKFGFEVEEAETEDIFASTDKDTTKDSLEEK